MDSQLRKQYRRKPLAENPIFLESGPNPSGSHWSMAALEWLNVDLWLEKPNRTDPEPQGAIEENIFAQMNIDLRQDWSDIMKGTKGFSVLPAHEVFNNLRSVGMPRGPEEADPAPCYQSSSPLRPLPQTQKPSPSSDRDIPSSPPVPPSRFEQEKDLQSLKRTRAERTPSTTPEKPLQQRQRLSSSTSPLAFCSFSGHGQGAVSPTLPSPRDLPLQQASSSASRQSSIVAEPPSDPRESDNEQNEDVQLFPSMDETDEDKHESYVDALVTSFFKYLSDSMVSSGKEFVIELQKTITIGVRADSVDTSADVYLRCPTNGMVVTAEVGESTATACQFSHLKADPF